MVRYFILFLFLCVHSNSWARATAILLSGGAKPYSNFSRYYANLKNAELAFSDRDLIFLVADGPGTELNSVAIDPVSKENKKDSEGAYLLERRDPEVTAGEYLPAKKAALQSVVHLATKKMNTADSMIFYVTDHGTILDSDQVAINLWRERLSVVEFREILGRIPESHPILMVQEQCFGAGILEALWDRNGLLRANSCGFAAAGPDEPAWEGGGLIKEVSSERASGKKIPFYSVYLKLLLSPTHRSVPTATTDLYLKKVFKDEYSGKIKNWLTPESVLSDRIDITAKTKALPKRMIVQAYEQLATLRSVVGFLGYAQPKRLRQSFDELALEVTEGLIDAHEKRVESSLARVKLRPMFDEYYEPRIGSLTQLEKDRIESMVFVNAAQDFASFVDKKRDAGEVDFSSDVVRAADSEFGKVCKTQRYQKTLYQAMLNYLVLARMLEEGDEIHLWEYLALLTCEKQEL